MSMSKGKNPVRSGSRRKSRETYFTLVQAEKMLPLVTHIVDDVRARWSKLTEMEKEIEALERRKRELDWPERQRRYQIQDEITKEHKLLKDTALELESLDVVLVDPVHGEAAFPTVINDEKAYFVWRVGSDQVRWWCFTNEPKRRPIPEAWRKVTELESKA